MDHPSIKEFSDNREIMNLINLVIVKHIEIQKLRYPNDSENKENNIANSVYRETPSLIATYRREVMKSIRRNDIPEDDKIALLHDGMIDMLQDDIADSDEEIARERARIRLENRQGNGQGNGLKRKNKKSRKSNKKSRKSNKKSRKSNRKSRKMY